MNLGAGQPASLPYGVEPPLWYSNQYPYHSVQFSLSPQQWGLPFSSPIYHPPPPDYQPPPPGYHPPPLPNHYSAYAYHPYQPSYPPTQPHFIPTNQFVPPQTTHETPPPFAYLREAKPDLQPCSTPLQVHRVSGSEVPIIDSRHGEFNFSDAKVSEFLESVSRLWDACISKYMKGIQSSEGSSPSLLDDAPPPTHTPKIQSSEPNICSPLQPQPTSKPSHLGDAQSLSVANLSMSRIKRASSMSIPATRGVKKRKFLQRNKLLMLKLSFKTNLRVQSSVAPPLLDDVISVVSNNTHASFCSVSDTGTLSFVNNGCGAVDSVFVASIPVGVSVRHDNQGPNSGEKGGERHALQLLDEMPQSKGLCSVRRTVADLTSIRDKGGGLAYYRPLEYAIGVKCAEEDDGFEKSGKDVKQFSVEGQLELKGQKCQILVGISENKEDPRNKTKLADLKVIDYGNGSSVRKTEKLVDGNAISEMGISNQFIHRNDILKFVSHAEVPIDGIVITDQSHVNEGMIKHEARAICEKFGDRVIGGTMSDGCLQVKAIRHLKAGEKIDGNLGLIEPRVSKGRDQNENDVKQDLKIFESSYFSGGTVVFSDIHELENYFQLDFYSSKSFVGLIPLKELLNMRCGSVKGEWDNLLASGSSVTLFTKDLSNDVWVSSDALKLVQSGLRTAFVLERDTPTDIVDDNYEKIIANFKRVLEIILEKWKSKVIILFYKEPLDRRSEMTQTNSLSKVSTAANLNSQDVGRAFENVLCNLVKLPVVIYSALSEDAENVVPDDTFGIMMELVGMSILFWLFAFPSTRFKRKAASIIQSWAYQIDHQLEYRCLIHYEEKFIIEFYGKSKDMELEAVIDATANLVIDHAVNILTSKFCAISLCVEHSVKGQTVCAASLASMLGDYDTMISKGMWGRNLVLWSAMFAQFATEGNANELDFIVKEVLKLNNVMMIRPSNTQSQVFTTLILNLEDVRGAFETFVSGVIKFHNPSSFNCKVGKENLLHDDIFRITGSVASSLIDMYAHCGVDIEETAFCLMMTSRGLGNSGQISSVADSSSKNSFSVEGVGNCPCDGDPRSSHIKRTKVGMSAYYVLDYKNGSRTTEVSEFGEIDCGQGFLSDEMPSGFMLYGLGLMKFGLSKKAVLKGVSVKKAICAIPEFECVASQLGITTFFASALQRYGMKLGWKVSASFPPNMYDAIGITEDFLKQVSMRHCFECDTYLQPQRTWIKTPVELNELLAFCVERLKNLNKFRTTGDMFRHATMDRIAILSEKVRMITFGDDKLARKWLFELKASRMSFLICRLTDWQRSQGYCVDLRIAAAEASMKKHRDTPFRNHVDFLKRRRVENPNEKDAWNKFVESQKSTWTCKICLKTGDHMSLECPYLDYVPEGASVGVEIYCKGCTFKGKHDNTNCVKRAYRMQCCICGAGHWATDCPRDKQHKTDP